MKADGSPVEPSHAAHEPLHSLLAVSALNDGEILSARNEGRRELGEAEERFRRGAERLVEEAFDALEEIAKEARFLGEMGPDRAAAVVNRLKLNAFVGEVLELPSSFRGERVTFLERITRQVYKSESELSDEEIRLGEQVQAIGRRVLNWEFHSFSLQRIMQDEIPEYFEQRIGEEDLEEWMSSRERVKQEFDEAVGQELRRHGSPDEPPPEISARRRGIVVDIRLKRRPARPGGGGRGYQAEHGRHKHADAQARPGSPGRARRKFQQGLKHFATWMTEGMVEFGKQEALGALAAGLKACLEPCSRLQRGCGFDAQGQVVDPLKRHHEAVERAVHGQVADFADYMSNLEPNLGKLESILSVLAERLERFQESITGPRPAGVMPDAPALLEKIRTGHRESVDGALHAAAVCFKSRAGEPLDGELCRALLGYSFYAQELGDEQAAETCFSAAHRFQRREVRAALQTLHHEEGLMQPEAYAYLRELCGQHREPPPVRVETEEEWEARLAALRREEERQELVGLALADYCSDESECQRMAQFVMPETYDAVLRSLRHALGEEETVTAFLRQNPQVFETAQNYPEAFRRYAYALLMNIQAINRRLTAGALDLSAYADPVRLPAALAADEAREQRAAERERLGRVLQNSGYESPAAVLAIYRVGFADGRGGYHTTATTRVPEERVFAKLREGLADYDESAELLRSTYARLVADKALRGQGAMAINLENDPKKRPQKDILRSLNRFVLEEPPAELPLRVREAEGAGADGD